MVPPERLKPTATFLKSSTLPLVDYTGIIQLFGNCIATWYVPVSFTAYGDVNQL